MFNQNVALLFTKVDVVKTKTIVGGASSILVIAGKSYAYAHLRSLQWIYHVEVKAGILPGSAFVSPAILTYDLLSRIRDDCCAWVVPIDTLITLCTGEASQWPNNEPVKSSIGGILNDSSIQIFF